MVTIFAVMVWTVAAASWWGLPTLRARHRRKRPKRDHVAWWKITTSGHTSSWKPGVHG